MPETFVLGWGGLALTPISQLSRHWALVGNAILAKLSHINLVRVLTIIFFTV